VLVFPTDPVIPMISGLIFRSLHRVSGSIPISTAFLAIDLIPMAQKIDEFSGLNYTEKCTV
jgi:hypothetical protein